MHVVPLAIVLAGLPRSHFLHTVALSCVLHLHLNSALALRFYGPSQPPRLLSCVLCAPPPAHVRPASCMPCAAGATPTPSPPALHTCLLSTDLDVSEGAVGNVEAALTGKRKRGDNKVVGVCIPAYWHGSGFGCPIPSTLHSIRATIHYRRDHSLFGTETDGSLDTSRTVGPGT